MIRVGWQDGHAYVAAVIALERVSAGPAIPEPGPRKTMRTIAEEVAAKHLISVDELRGDCRHKYAAHPRHEAMWAMRQVRCADGSHRYSLPLIGRFFGRDHTTVLAACRAHERRMAARGKA